MQAYFDEWVFRFNRRHSQSRGLLFHRLMQQSVLGDAIIYKELRKAGRTRPAPAPPTGPRSLPPSLDIGDVGLPWRRSLAGSSENLRHRDGDPHPPDYRGREGSLGGLNVAMRTGTPVGSQAWPAARLPLPMG